jgi:hypothetical protein
MTRAARAPRRQFRHIFGAPIALALLGCAGLLSALIGDGIFDALSWLALAAPIAVIGWYLARRDTNR